jgi:hypothetical protein
MGRYGLKTAQKASQSAELPDREILMSCFSAEGDALQGFMGLKRFLLDIKSTKSVLTCSPSKNDLSANAVLSRQ